jgi:mercuric ion transport protein
MKAAWVSVVTAVAASVCCIGPVLAVTAGASALTVVAVRFEPFPPAFLTLTVALLGFAFYGVYRPSPAECAADAACLPSANRRAKLLVWLVAVVVLLLVTFPYYVEYMF